MHQIDRYDTVIPLVCRLLYYAPELTLILVLFCAKSGIDCNFFAH